jgi:hypothetical protein
MVTGMTVPCIYDSCDRVADLIGNHLGELLARIIVAILNKISARIFHLDHTDVA